MICDCEYIPLPLGAHVMLQLSGRRGIVRSWTCAGFCPRAETTVYVVDLLDDQTARSLAVPASQVRAVGRPNLRVIDGSASHA